MNLLRPLKTGLLALSLFTFFSCANSKQLPYFKDLADLKALDTVSTLSYRPLLLESDDEIEININSSSPEAAQFFNLTPNTNPTPEGQDSYIRFKQQGQAYRINEKGFVTIPVLGDLPVAGMSTTAVKDTLTVKLREYLKDVVVSVKLVNFKVTVIGEVNKPLVIPVNGERINVLEAVGASGDMTIYGIRKNVKILRRLPDGKTQVAVLDFNNSSSLRSPFFQLKQNDIVYIQPNKNKGLAGTQATIWVPIITSLLSIVAIILTLN